MAAAFVAERLSFVTTVGSGTTQAVTVASNCSAGNLVVLFVARSGAGEVSGVTDSRGNTWAIAVSRPGSTSFTGAIVYTLQDVGTLITSDTITVTWASDTGGNRGIRAIEVSSPAATPLDKVAENDASTGTAISSTATAALAQADEFAVGLAVIGTTSTTLTGDSPWTDTPGGKLAFSQQAQTSYRVISATDAISYDATQGASQRWVGLVATFKATAADASLVIPHRWRRSALLRM